MTQPTLHATYAFDIIHVLERHAGLRDDAETHRQMVEAFQNPSLREYRFMGSLGFGGKFWCDGRWRVTCYREDETPARLKAIDATNEALQKLQGLAEKIEARRATLPPLEELLLEELLILPRCSPGPRSARYRD